jgi:hypothetical protein
MLESQLDQELGDPIPCRLGLRCGRCRRFRRQAGVSGRRRVRVNTLAPLGARGHPDVVFVHAQGFGQEPRQAGDAASWPPHCQLTGRTGRGEALIHVDAMLGAVVDSANSTVPSVLWPESCPQESTARPPRIHRAAERRWIWAGIGGAVGEVVGCRKPSLSQRVSYSDLAPGVPGIGVALPSRHDEHPVRA